MAEGSFTPESVAHTSLNKEPQTLRLHPRMQEELKTRKIEYNEFGTGPYYYSVFRNAEQSRVEQPNAIPLPNLIIEPGLGVEATQLTRAAQAVLQTGKYGSVVVGNALISPSVFDQGTYDGRDSAMGGIISLKKQACEQALDHVNGREAPNVVYAFSLGTMPATTGVISELMEDEYKVQTVIWEAPVSTYNRGARDMLRGMAVSTATPLFNTMEALCPSPTTIDQARTQLEALQKRDTLNTHEQEQMEFCQTLLRRAGNYEMVVDPMIRATIAGIDISLRNELNIIDSPNAPESLKKEAHRRYNNLIKVRRDHLKPILDNRYWGKIDVSGTWNQKKGKSEIDSIPSITEPSQKFTGLKNLARSIFGIKEVFVAGSNRGLTELKKFKADHPEVRIVASFNGHDEISPEGIAANIIDEVVETPQGAIPLFDKEHSAMRRHAPHVDNLIDGEQTARRLAFFIQE